MKFIDYAKIFIKSGDGGNGHISFRREKFVPKGGPDGGNGGRGGDVIIQVARNMNTLMDYKYKRHYSAEDGHHGQKKKCTGKDGKDIIIKVPLGTIIKDAADDSIIADLTETEQQAIIARGGRGGRGNAEFTTSTRQTPRFAEDGKPGKEMEIKLELKLIADVGLVGFPNVGKSTLISVISAAKPKIADYPFTTLVPNLGIVHLEDYKSFTVADIPGLIEGAHEGKGLGDRFLRHVERTRVLVFLLEPMREDPKADYNILLNELIHYNPEMRNKKKIICFSKIDILDEETFKEVKKITFDEECPVLYISSVAHIELDTLKWAMWEILSAEE